MAQRYDWSIIPNKNGIMDVRPQDFHYYDLYNVTNSEALCYGERTWGINLRWCDPAKSENVRFVRQGGGNGPIVFDEPIAIHVRGGSFLVHQSGRRGINLGWSDSPRYEWQIKTDKGAPGSSVKAGTLVGLYNAVENDFLMYEQRDWGINLKWLGDSGKHQELSRGLEVAKDARSFLATYGTLVTG